MKTPTPHRLLCAAALSFALGSAATGCAAARATFNIDAGWAITEPSPMSVVMHRGAVARDVAGQTDAMLRTLPADATHGDSIAMDEAEARKNLQLAAAGNTYAQKPFRVVPAEAWKLKLAATCSEENSDASIIASLGGDAAAEFAKVDTMVKAVAATKGQISTARRDARKAKGEDKEPHKARATELKEKLKTQKDELKPEMKAMVEQLEAAAMELPADAKERLAPVTFNLLAAVKDAESANAAAILRYPMALSKLPDELQPTVQRIVADVIEDQTGQRPDTKNMEIKVGLENGKVKLEIAGLDREAMGKLSAKDIIKETSKRSQAWVKDVFTLPGRLDETATRLLFQKRVLKAVAKGLEVPADVTKISKLKVTGAEATPGAPEALAAACDPPTPDGDELEESDELEEPEQL